MLHFNVRRLTAAVALVLVLAAVPALAAPGPRPHAVPVASLSLLDRLLDWLGFPIAGGLPGLHILYQRNTASDPIPTTNGTRRGVQVDPNG